MLKIGDFSKLSRISVRMLRHYDEIGLLVPQNTDRFTGYRYYTERQLPVANRITALKNMGFGLSVIREILVEYNDPEKLCGYLRLKKTELEEAAGHLGRQILLLENTLKTIRKDGMTMKYDVTLKQLPQRNVASLRKIIPSYAHEGMLWQMMMEETAPLHMQDGEPCYTIAVFYDAEYKEQDVDVEIQKCVKGKYPDTEHVVFKTVPPIQMASATYQGSYDKISEVNAAVANWIHDNGYVFDGLSFCIYHVSPHETQNEDEFVTEVCYPVRKK